MEAVYSVTRKPPVVAGVGVFFLLKIILIKVTTKILLFVVDSFVMVVVVVFLFC